MPGRPSPPDLETAVQSAPVLEQQTTANNRGQKRPRESVSESSIAPLRTNSSLNSTPAAAPPRRIQSVIFSGFEIQAQFTSPYPFDDLIPANQVASGSGTSVGGSSSWGKRALGNGQARSAKEVEVTPRNKTKKNDVKGKQVEILDELDVFPISNAKSIPLSTPAGVIPIPLLASSTASRISPHPIKAPSTGLYESKVRTRRMSTTNSASPLVASTSLHPPVQLVPLTSSSLSRSPSLSESLASAPRAIPVVEIPVKRRRGTTRILRVDDGSNTIELSKGKKERIKSDGNIDPISIPSLMPESFVESSTSAESLKTSPPSPKRGGGKSLLPPMPKVNGNPATNGSTVVTSKLFVCDYCFKYMLQGAALVDHMKKCSLRGPPGRKVYERGVYSIWEVDGATAKLYCQNLCLFAKLFIEHKYMFFDVEGFMFYVMSYGTPSHDYVMAYFSKEKVSYDEYNLACIVTFPPYQKQGCGTLLIEFSYEINRSANIAPGTPERPLSDSGLKGYLTYWTSVLVRHFRRLFDELAPPPSSSASEVMEEPNDTKPSDNEGSKRSLRTASTTLTLRRSATGFDKASISPRQSPAPPTRQFITHRPVTHSSEEDFSHPTNLEEIAEATNLRLEDVAFALVESGLACWRKKRQTKLVISAEDTEMSDVGAGEVEEEEGEEVIITREMVEAVGEKLKVKDVSLVRSLVLL